MKELKDGQHLVVAAKSGSLKAVTDVLNVGDNLNLLDVEEACLAATKKGYKEIVEAILIAYPHNFIAGKVLIEAVSLNDLAFTGTLLSYHPEWTDCLRAKAKANELGHTAIANLISPQAEPPEGLKNFSSN
jgi:hypothetical protein